jgi:hypothetical protein
MLYWYHRYNFNFLHGRGGGLEKCIPNIPVESLSPHTTLTNITFIIIQNIYVTKYNILKFNVLDFWDVMHRWPWPSLGAKPTLPPGTFRDFHFTTTRWTEKGRFQGLIFYIPYAHTNSPI